MEVVRVLQRDGMEGSASLRTSTEGRGVRRSVYKHDLCLERCTSANAA